MTPSPSSQQTFQPSISPSPIQLPFQQQHHQPQQIVTPTVQQPLNHHQQDGLLVVTTNNTTTFVSGTTAGTTTTHDQVQEQRVKTPNRRSSLTHQSSPNAGGTAVTYRPSPTQSPAHLSTSSSSSTTVSSTTTYNSFGTVPAGHEFNTTLVGSNNISLNKVSFSF